MAWLLGGSMVGRWLSFGGEEGWWSRVGGVAVQHQRLSLMAFWSSPRWQAAQWLGIMTN